MSYVYVRPNGKRIDLSPYLPKVDGVMQVSAEKRLKVIKEHFPNLLEEYKEVAASSKRHADSFIKAMGQTPNQTGWSNGR